MNQGGSLSLQGVQNGDRSTVIGRSSVSGRGRTRGVIQIGRGPAVSGRGRARRVILIGCRCGGGGGGGAVVRGRGVVQHGVRGGLRAAVTVGGRVAAGGGEEGGAAGGGRRGGEGAVQRGGARGGQRARLQAPQELLVVAGQALLLGALLLHGPLQVGVLLGQLPAGHRPSLLLRLHSHYYHSIFC